MLDLKRVMAAAPRKPDGTPLKQLLTPWGEQILEASSAPASPIAQPTAPISGNEATAIKTAPKNPNATADKPDAAQHQDTNPFPAQHPHPQFQRDSFICLNGLWDYAFINIADATWANASNADPRTAASAWRSTLPPTTWDGKIRLPFSPEASLSGVGRQLQPNQLLWYRLQATAPQLTEDQLLILHFEAVDYACRCLVNGREVGTHTGGYLPFSFDITSESALAQNELEILLCVWDPSDTGVQLRGKQRLERGGIWYTAQSGIWQMVWLETVPSVHLRQARILPRPDDGLLEVRATANTTTNEALTVILKSEGTVITQGAATIREEFPEQLLSERESSLGFNVTLTVENPHLWSLEDPFLYQLELTLGNDIVHSYCAFRTTSIEPDEAGIPRFCLNHQPLLLKGVLDQGYWPDGLLSAPCDEALNFDIQTMKAAGFNLLRKHIKVEQDRWYYHCDILGMLVWQDIVSGGEPLSPWHSSYKPTLFRKSWGRKPDNTPRHWKDLSAESEEYRTEWLATCVLTVRYLDNHPSVAIWGLFNEGWGQFNSQAAVQAVRLVDPTRPIDATSGWYDQGGGDFLSVHNYFRPLEVYCDDVNSKRAFVLSEFGGISWPVPGHVSLETEYGYGSASNSREFAETLKSTLSSAEALEEEGLAGFVYTQLSDVEEETNGLLTYDRRTNKMDVAQP